MNSIIIDILLADDDNDDCLFFEEALIEVAMPTRLTVVSNGTELMHYLHNNAANLPHLLFLDLNMPRKNGLECLAEIKGNDKLKGLPVVIISTSYNERTADLAFKTGAHFYICKPTDFVQLKKEIRHALHELAVQCNLAQPPKERFFISQLTTTPLLK